MNILSLAIIISITFSLRSASSLSQFHDSITRSIALFSESRTNILASQRVPTPLSIFKTQFPYVKWSTTKEADFNCDGVVDYAQFGRTSSSIVVGILIAPLTYTSKPQTLEFPIDADTQNSLSGSDIRFKIESFNFKETQIESAKATTCKGLYLDDGMTDKIHIFWEGSQKSFLWWRN